MINKHETFPNLFDIVCARPTKYMPIKVVMQSLVCIQNGDSITYWLMKIGMNLIDMPLATIMTMLCMSSTPKTGLQNDEPISFFITSFSSSSALFTSSFKESSINTVKEVAK